MPGANPGHGQWGHECLRRRRHGWRGSGPASFARRTATCRRRRSCRSARRGLSRGRSGGSSARGDDRARQHVPPELPARRRRRRRARGLHSFMGWTGRSGRFGRLQVFSLRRTLEAVDDDGVTFRSGYDGDLARLTERAAKIQADLGSDIAMCLDVCPPPECRTELAQATRLTTAWARGSARRPARPASWCSESRKARATPTYAAARSRRSPSSTSTATRWAGSAWEETERRCSRRSRGPRPASSRQAALLHGHRRPEGVLKVIERGIDMFDCVLPTQLGRTGTAITRAFTLNLERPLHRDPRPLDAWLPAASAVPTSAT